VPEWETRIALSHPLRRVVGEMTIGAAATELSALTEAIDGLELSVDRDTIVGALRERDRLDARIAAAVAAFDTAELWDCDGATSMTRWLVDEARLGDSTARRLVRTAGRLREWPTLAQAFTNGEVSAGQVEHVAQKVRPHHVELFADHEAALVPALALLDLDATITVVREWVDKADALIDTEPAAPKASTLHLNTVGDRGRLDSDLTSDDLAIVAEALRLATRSDDDTDPRRRTRAERAAGALVDMSRRFLRDHETPKTAPGRQRPGVNVVIDAPALAALELRELGIGTIADLDDHLNSQPTTAVVRAWYRSGLDHLCSNHRRAATTLSGHDLSPALAAAFSCDATMRRLLTTGSTLLDYSRPMPTLPTSVRDAVILRDRRCRFPRCRRGIDWCEVHHIRHRVDGGPDSITNCVLLCAHHHHVLHRDGWNAHLEPDGTLAIAGPHDRHWITRPPGPTNGPSPPHLTYGA
jgi:hypothetical protein